MLTSALHSFEVPNSKSGSKWDLILKLMTTTKRNQLTELVKSDRKSLCGCSEAFVGRSQIRPKSRWPNWSHDFDAFLSCLTDADPLTLLKASANLGLLIMQRMCIYVCIYLLFIWAAGLFLSLFLSFFLPQALLTLGPNGCVATIGLVLMLAPSASFW